MKKRDMSVRRWVTEADEPALRDLFLLEKAGYDICYEAASRPSWLGIPVRGPGASPSGSSPLPRGRRMDEEPRIAQALQAVIDGRSLDPFAVLGPHRSAFGNILRVMSRVP